MGPKGGGNSEMGVEMGRPFFLFLNVALKIINKNPFRHGFFRERNDKSMSL